MRLSKGGKGAGAATDVVKAFLNAFSSEIRSPMNSTADRPTLALIGERDKEAVLPP